MMPIKCNRKYITCKGNADGIINNKPVCSGCKERKEGFDKLIKGE